MDIKRPDLKRKKLHRQVLYGGVILAALIAGGVALSALEPAAPRVARNELWTGTVQRGNFVRDIQANGQLSARSLWSVDTAVGGRVERVLVKPGAQVDANTVLVELSNPGLIQQMQEAEWALEAAAAEYKALEAKLRREALDAEGDVQLAQIELRGVASDVEADRELAEKGVISRRQYRDSKGKAEQLGIRLELLKDRVIGVVESNKALLDAQNARVEQAKRLLHRYQEQVENLRLTASINGELTEVNVHEGQQLVLGANVARVAKTDDLIAELAVGEIQIRDVQLGQNVKVDTHKGIVFGKVTRIDPKVSNGTVTVDVSLTDNLPAGTRLDTSIKGSIELESIPNALFVTKPQYSAANAEVSVFRFAEDGEYAHRVPVKFGAASVTQIQILSSLHEGDVIVLRDDEGAWREVSKLRLY